LQPYGTNGPALVLASTAAAGVQDSRVQFRAIYCAVLDARGQLPDHRPCDQALTRLSDEPPAQEGSVDLEPSRRHLVMLVVPGIGFDCFKHWLEPPGTVVEHLRTQGFDGGQLSVDALSGSSHNARQIRDALLAIPEEAGQPRIVLLGYSKGAPDILEALATYPEIRSRVAAFVSAAGAIGGSALANDASQYQADLLRHFPGSECKPGDGQGVASLRPDNRRRWLAENPLPAGIRYYSLVTLPDPERISGVLKSSYRKLARVDGRNDSQVIFYDQVLPGSQLLGYVNADHWALAVPIARSHTVVGRMIVTRNDYPREALSEALLRFIEADLDADQAPRGP
jgi:pimeloyl-ACP methyl ester carboxylesterase